MWVVSQVIGDKVKLTAHPDTRRLSSGKLPGKTVSLDKITRRNRK